MKYGTKHSPIFLPTFVSNIATFKKSAYDPNIAFFPFQRLLQNSGKNRCFNIPFKSSSMAGEVRNETLANFFANMCQQHRNFEEKHLRRPKHCIFSFPAVVAKQKEKQVFSTSFSKVAAWQVKYGTKLSPFFLPTFVSNIATF